MQDKQDLLKAWVESGENVDMMETRLVVQRSHQADLNRGRRQMTISQMQKEGFSEPLVWIEVYRFYYLWPIIILKKIRKSPEFREKKHFWKLTPLRAKIQGLIAKGGEADPDAPDDPASVRFWASIGGSYNENERSRVGTESTANIKLDTAAVSNMLGGLGGAGATPPQLMPPATGPSPSLTALVAVMNAGSSGSGSTPTPAPTPVDPGAPAPATPAPGTPGPVPNAKPKPKPKPRPSLKDPKTPDEWRAAARI